MKKLLLTVIGVFNLATLNVSGQTLYGDVFGIDISGRGAVASWADVEADGKHLSSKKINCFDW